MNKIIQLVQKYTDQGQADVGRWRRLCQVLAGTRDEHRAMEVLSHYTNEELVYLLEHRTDRSYSPEHEHVIHAYRSAQVRGNQVLMDTMNTLKSEHARDIYGVLSDVFTTAHHIHSQIVDAVRRIYGDQYRGVPHIQLFARSGYTLSERRNISSALPASSYEHTIDPAMDMLLAKPDLKPHSDRSVMLLVDAYLRKNIVDCTLKAVHTYGDEQIGIDYFHFYPRKHNTVPLLLLHDFLVAHHPVNFSDEIVCL